MSKTENALITKDAIKPSDVFKVSGGDALIAHVAAQIKDFVPDVSTVEGRDEIKSTAFKIARSKTLIDEIGKTYVADLKAAAKIVDVERGRIWDALEAMQTELRKPLTDWESADEERIEAHKNILEGISLAKADYAVNWKNCSLESMTIFLDEFLPKMATRDWDEFSEIAHPQIGFAMDCMKQFIADRHQYDADQAELSRLREEQTKREAKERDERLQKEAADKARADAEAEANKKAADELARQDAEQAKLRQEKEDAERREREAKETAEKAERDSKAAADKAAQDAKDAADKAERDRLAAIEKAEADKVAAINAERQRQADEITATAAAEEKRKADKDHRDRILMESSVNLVDNSGVDLTTARRVLEEISKGTIRHVSIKF